MIIVVICAFFLTSAQGCEEGHSRCGKFNTIKSCVAGNWISKPCPPKRLCMTTSTPNEAFCRRLIRSVRW
ncbi:hypothetical protein AX774_g5796 [Zancudomyces culisetae]|uniref:Uncharacterized protein n=1 Tax=Zancudomyces culisetae TaxID=1213189 RepID=A0A1R1PIS6_ZANCU|nr:hypothetical protein AX774_g5796 [Zancudomyces culisetae]|eukprot:OMH80752.1 hypothetical protein AX774_g5796 [Zancudomyces culisetae]